MGIYVNPNEALLKRAVNSKIYDDVKTMIAGRHIDVNVDKFLNTMTDFHSKDAVFAYLIHLGYLAYDSTTKQCYIPNNEIRSEWIYAVEDDSDYAKAIEYVRDTAVCEGVGASRNARQSA